MTGRARLRGTRPTAARAAVILLHGGGEHGHEHVSWNGAPVLRMVPFGWELRRRGGERLAVVRLKNRVFGWNGHAAEPVEDGRWALGAVRTAYPGAPVVLVGHSMGGRVALALAADEGVAAVAALAPWVPPGEPVVGGPGLRALLMHGTHDRITDPEASRRRVDALRARGVVATWRPVRREIHSMLLRPSTWHHEVADFVLDAVNLTLG